MPIYRAKIVVEETCSRCGGTGILETMAIGSNANPITDCPDCEGKGWKETQNFQSGILLNQPKFDSLHSKEIPKQADGNGGSE